MTNGQAGQPAGEPTAPYPTHSCPGYHRAKARQRPPRLEGPLALWLHILDKQEPPPCRTPVDPRQGARSIPSLPGRHGGGTRVSQRLRYGLHRIPHCRSCCWGWNGLRKGTGRGKQTYFCTPVHRPSARYSPHLHSPSFSGSETEAEGLKHPARLRRLTAALSLLPGGLSREGWVLGVTAFLPLPKCVEQPRWSPLSLGNTIRQSQPRLGHRSAAPEGHPELSLGTSNRTTWATPRFSHGALGAPRRGLRGLGVEAGLGAGPWWGALGPPPSPSRADFLLVIFGFCITFRSNKRLQRIYKKDLKSTALKQEAFVQKQDVKAS